MSDPSSSGDDWDQHWDEYADAAERNPAQAYRRRLILDLLDPAAGSRILDIGSGQGDLAADLSAAFPQADIAGIELSRSGVERASKKVPTASFTKVDLLADTGPPASLRNWATHATCSEVIEHVDDPVALLVAARQYLAPGAKVVVTVPGGPRTAFDKHIGHRRHYSRRALVEVLEAAGFRVDGAWSAGFPFFNVYKLVVLMSGRRLVRDARAGAAVSTSSAARFIAATFRALFRLNLRGTPFGWQLLALAVRDGDSGRS